jgi:hypothetical protein
MVAGDWPGGLVSLLLLDLPIQGAYFPTKYHTPWHSTVAFQGIHEDMGNVIYIPLRVIDFLWRIMTTLWDCQQVIVTVDVVRTGASCSALQRVVRNAHELCAKLGLHPLVIGNAVSGGASDAQHMLGFGCDLLSTRIPVVEVGLRCTVRNVLDGGVEGQFLTVLKCYVTPLENPARTVLWHNSILRPEGLFPCWMPDAKVYCPSHRLRHCWVVRTLTIAEKL